MNKEDLQNYTTRIVQANRSDLVVLVFELAFDSIDAAMVDYEDAAIESMTANLKKAQKYVNELVASLDYNYAIARNLFQLYQYVEKILIGCIVRQDCQDLDSARKVLAGLQVGFEGVAKQDDSAPVMQRGTQLYAGLTYGKGTLNEVFVDVGTSGAGYKA